MIFSFAFKQILVLSYLLHSHLKLVSHLWWPSSDVLAPPLCQSCDLSNITEAVSQLSSQSFT